MVSYNALGVGTWVPWLQNPSDGRDISVFFGGSLSLFSGALVMLLVGESELKK